MPKQTKSAEMRLAEVIEIYAKLREARVFDDPGLVQLKKDCQDFVRDSVASRGTCRIHAIDRDLEYDLTVRSGKRTVAVVKAPVDE